MLSIYLFATHIVIKNSFCVYTDLIFYIIKTYFKFVHLIVQNENNIINIFYIAYDIIKLFILTR